MDKGARINSQDKTSMTALHGAAFYGKVPVVRCLVEKGANVDLRTCKGYTALHLAVLKHRLDIVQELF